MLRALSTLVVVAASCCPVSADLVVFSNEGNEFVWNARRQGVTCPGQEVNNYLDVTLPSSQAGDSESPSGFWYDSCVGLTSGTCQQNDIHPISGMVACAAALVAPIPQCNPGSGPFRAMRMHLAGETVGPESLWFGAGSYGYTRPGGHTSLVNYPGAVGLRFNLKGQPHYAFIVLTSRGVPMMWGYETEPNTAITIPPYNDDCVGAPLITQYSYAPFDTAGLSIGAPAAPACDFDGSDQIENDMWYKLVAPETADMLISTVGLTQVDTKIAVYLDVCPVNQPITCNDDNGPGGAGAQASVAFAATAGARYLVRIGNSPGAPAGAGFVNFGLYRPQVIAGPIFDPSTRHAYYALRASSWVAAQAEATVLRGNLATINDAAENEFVRASFASLGARMWIGINDAASEGNFVWAGGVANAFTNWAPGQPAAGALLDYGAMDSTTGLWSNVENRPGADLPFAIVEVAVPVPTAPAAGNKAGDRAYFRHSPSTYLEAQAHAQTILGNLVTVDNAAENELIRTRLVAGLPNPLDAAWIGLNDANVEGTFRLTSGLPATFFNWAPGAPDNNGNEDYVVMQRDGFWNDLVNDPQPPLVNQVSSIAEVNVPTVLQGPFQRPGSCHRYYVLNNSNWLQAEAAAQALGGHLVTIDDAEEEGWISGIVFQAGRSTYWTGYNDYVSEGVFRWSSGAATTRTNWSRNAPPADTGANADAVLFDFFPFPTNSPGWTLPLNGTSGSPGVVEIGDPACPCDWNMTDGVNSQDFFDFLVVFFENNADFNCDGTTNSQDFFDFLGCFFAPPPGCSP